MADKDTKAAPRTEPKSRVSIKDETSSPRPTHRLVKPVPPKDKPTAAALRVTARPSRGFWRAKRRWSSTPSIVLLSELAEGQAAQLLEEPNLVVEEVLVELEDPPEVS